MNLQKCEINMLLAPQTTLFATQSLCNRIETGNVNQHVDYFLQLSVKGHSIKDQTVRFHLA